MAKNANIATLLHFLTLPNR